MGSVRSIVILVGFVIGCNAGSPGSVSPPAPAVLDADSGGSDGSGEADAMEADATPDARSSWPNCIPYQTPCGRCGLQEILCIEGKHVPSGTCGGEHGDCTPPASEESANKCSVRTCLDTCKWGPSTLKPGNMCSTGQSRSCVTNPATCGKPTGVQECVNCKWTGCLCK